MLTVLQQEKLDHPSLPLATGLFQFRPLVETQNGLVFSY